MCALTQTRVVDEGKQLVNCLQSQEFYETGVQVHHAARSRQLRGVRERVDVECRYRVRESNRLQRQQLSDRQL